MSRYHVGLPEHHENSRFTSRVMNDPLAVIYNQNQWRICRASALCNLQYNAVKLKQYASKIKQTVISSITTNTKTKYSVSVESEPNLKYSEEDGDAIIITVFANTAEGKGNPKIVYESLLLSWGVCDTVPNAVHLPYMLERGEQKVANAVKTALGTMFDCKIEQFTFTQLHLLHFGFNFIETETSNFDKKVGFTFSTPQPEMKDKLTIHFEIGDVYMIWNDFKEETNRRSELVSLTFRSLQNQIFHMFELNITALRLCEVSLPRAGIKANGTVKMKTPEMVNSMFTVLNQISNLDIV